MRSSILAIAILLALPACTTMSDTSPASASAQPAAAAASPSVDTMKRLVQELLSDAYEGRAPGSAGEEKTLALLSAEFAKLGLKPGNNGSWFQDCLLYTSPSPRD